MSGTDNNTLTVSTSWPFELATITAVLPFYHILATISLITIASMHSKLFLYLILLIDINTRY